MRATFGRLVRLATVSRSKICALQGTIRRMLGIYRLENTSIKLTCVRLWRNMVLASRVKMFIIYNCAGRIGDAYDEASSFIARKAYSAWQSFFRHRMHTAKEDAEQYAASLTVCVEHAAKSADAAVKLIQVPLCD